MKLKRGQKVLDGRTEKLVPELTVSQQRARLIMGGNFISPAEVTKCLGLSYGIGEIEKLARIPYSESFLKKCREDYVLFPGISHDNEGNPLTIQQLQKMYPEGGQPCFYSYGCPDSDYAIREVPDVRWYLIRREGLPDSFGKTSEEHKAMLQKGQAMERAVVYIYLMLLYFKSRNERLFEDHFVRSGDFFSGFARAFCGCFTSSGIRFFTWWDQLRQEEIGIAPSIRPQRVFRLR